MTFIGKFFVMINLAISLLMATAAFGLYAGGIDWSDRGAKEGYAAGKLLALRKEIDDATADLLLAEQSWRTARDEMVRYENIRREKRAWFDDQIANLFSGKEPLKMVELGVKSPREVVDIDMVPAKDSFGADLLIRPKYEEKLADHRKTNSQLREDLLKEVKKNEELTHLLTGDKDTDPEPRLRGLRRQFEDELFKREEIIVEQGRTEAIQIDTVLEYEQVTKRLAGLQTRITELVGYLKKKHGVDVAKESR